jgi:glutamate--cysteine ligase
MVPHLATALTGPLLDLEKKILDATPAIERWFRLEWQEHTPPFYCSVDLRNAGYKLAPVDTNLFPGGFNNLSTEMLPLTVQAAMAAIDKYCPDARNLLLIPESHTRNPLLPAERGAPDADLPPDRPARAPRFAVAGSHPADAAGAAGREHAGGRAAGALGQRAPPGPGRFRPVHDPAEQRLIGGIPSILENIHEQSLLPPVHAGWALRRKSNHFKAFDEVAKKFGKLIDIDPWMVNPLHASQRDRPSTTRAPRPWPTTSRRCCRRSRRSTRNTA